MNEIINKYLNEAADTTVLNVQFNKIYNALETVTKLIKERKFQNAVKDIDADYIKSLNNVLSNLDNVYADLEDIELELSN